MSVSVVEAFESAIHWHFEIFMTMSYVANQIFKGNYNLCNKNSIAVKVIFLGRDYTSHVTYFNY